MDGEDTFDFDGNICKNVQMKEMEPKNSLDRWITWFCALILCISWVMTILVIQGDRRLEISRAGNETANLANVLGKYVFASFSQIENSLFSMRQTWEAGIDSEEMRRILHQYVLSRPDLFNLISMLDAQGNILFTDQENTKSTYSGDRPFFVYHRDHPDRKMRIEPPILGRVTGKWYIPLSVRLQDSQGNFKGVLIASVNPFYFSMIFQEAKLDKNSLIYLADSEGTIYSGMLNGMEFSLDKKISQRKAAGHLPRKSTFTEIEPSELDGVNRIKSFASIRDRPMFVSASVSLEECLKHFYSRTLLLIISQLVFSAFIFLFLVRLRKAVISRDAFSNELEDVKKHMDMTLQATHISIFDIDFLTKQFTITPALFELLGYSPDELPRSIDDLAGLIHPEDSSRLMKIQERNMSGEDVCHTAEFRVRRKQGDWAWNSATGVILKRDDMQNPLQLMGVCWDINNRKLAEEVLRLSEERLSFALSATNDGLWDWNVLTNNVFFSPRYYTMLGYEPGEFPPNFESWKALLHPAERDQAVRQLQDCIKGNSPQLTQEFRLRTKEDGWKWILSRGRMVAWAADGTPVRMAGTHVDISAHKAAEQALRESEENLRVTLNSIGDAVIATDTCRNITRMNTVAERLTGWKAADAPGHPLAEIFSIVNAASRKPVECPVSKALASGEIAELAERALLIDREGREYLIAASGAPIRNDKGEIIGVVLVFRDITEEYALQEQLRQSQKMDAVGQLAGGVAHDFNNMLGGIMGAAELLVMQSTGNSKERELLRLILDSAQRAAQLTSQLLAFSRKKVAALDRTDIHKPLQDAFSIIERTIDKRIGITKDLSADTLLVMGDHSQLQNMFLNILINSSHAMQEGGRIFVSTRKVELNSTDCESSPFKINPGEFVEVAIRDTGCGIPPEILPRIFEPFFTTKTQGKGTGLGLAAVYGIIQQHKGAITVYSEVGIGTCCHILLPKVESGEQISPKALPVPIRGSGLILVIDDEAVMRTTAGAILGKLGYQVMLAENGRQGADLYRENWDRIDLVLLDMIMPEMNGRDCFMALKAINPDVQVVLSSGFVRDEDMNVLKAAGLKGFIKKPYLSMELSLIVHAALSS